jgi:hypothetical protein
MIRANDDDAPGKDVGPGPGPGPGPDGLYVYCVAPSRGHWLLGPLGLDGQTVFTIHRAGLCCLVHACSAKAYQSADAPTVEKWVVAHQRVVEAAMKAFGTALPMAFNMIVQAGPGGDAARCAGDWLAEKHEHFAALLDRLAGKAEFGVQVLWDTQVVAAKIVQDDPALRELGGEALAKPKGQAYMLRQKLAKDARQAVEQRARQCVEEFFTSIRQTVEEVRVDKPRKCDGRLQMLLNLSCLAEPPAADLGAVLEQIQSTPGVSVRFTGPWPPYSFVRTA